MKVALIQQKYHDSREKMVLEMSERTEASEFETGDTQFQPREVKHTKQEIYLLSRHPWMNTPMHIIY